MKRLLVTVDIVLFSIRDHTLQVLLIRRLAKPFDGSYALPGGFVLEEESLEAAAARELSEETGLQNAYLEQLYTFGDPARDPRGRVISVAYCALASDLQELRAGSDAGDAAWFAVSELPALAFDHDEIIRCARQRLRNKLDYTNVGFELLPAEFTLSELQSVHEAILDENLDKRNFRRKITQSKIVKPTEQWRYTGRKPAQLYRFNT